MEVFKGNPHIHRLIQHREETPIEKLAENIEHVRKQFKCEKVIDFSESIEVSLSQHPRSPNYKLSKKERLERFNRNFYEYAFEWMAKRFEYEEDGNIYVPSINWCQDDYKPELFFEPDEKYRVRVGVDSNNKEIYEDHKASQFIQKDKFNILIGMSGSGTNKTWPWTEALAFKICENYPDVHIITVGDEKCRLIEPELEGRITNLSGKIPMRMSMEMTSLVDLVIAPDTGIIHASGCYDTPKICLLGHNTKECITKHFTNDYSVESDPELAPCSPCLFLIYNKDMQCPTDQDAGGSSFCMSKGIPMETIYSQFERVYAQFKKRS